MRMAAVMLLAVGMVFGVAGEAAAFRLVPVVMDFEPSGRGATQSFGVINSTAEPVAVEVSMVRRDVDIDGKETYFPEEEDFVVFPPQMVVMPGKVQTVRVRWVGEPSPDTELNYRIIATQLPIELNKVQQPGARIRLLVRYEGSIYIVPKGAAADVTVDSVQSAMVDQGRRKLAVVLHNRGTAHGVLIEPKLTVSTAGGKSIELVDPEQLVGIANANILAGNKRRFLLPWPDGLSEGSLEARLETTYTR